MLIMKHMCGVISDGLAFTVYLFVCLFIELYQGSLGSYNKCKTGVSSLACSCLSGATNERNASMH